MKVNEIITNRIIEKLEQGKIPWKREWSLMRSWSRATGKSYSLINSMLVDGGEYATFKQIKEENGKINKGAKQKILIFYKDVTARDENGEPITDDKGNEKTFPCARYYNVFNIDDTSLTKKHHKNDEAYTGKTYEGKERHKAIDMIINKYLDKYHINKAVSADNKCCYIPGENLVRVVDFDRFKTEYAYYSTLFHELAHSTGNASRLKRELGNRKGTSKYAFEELVAEISAGILCSICGIETDESFENTAAYVQGWLRVLKDNPNYIVKASAYAEKAVKMILDCEDLEKFNINDITIEGDTNSDSTAEQSVILSKEEVEALKYKDLNKIIEEKRGNQKFYTAIKRHGQPYKIEKSGYSIKFKNSDLSFNLYSENGYYTIIEAVTGVSIARESAFTKAAKKAYNVLNEHDVKSMITDYYSPVESWAEYKEKCVA